MMERGIQKILAGKAKVTEAALSMILNGKRRPGWKIANRLAQATNTQPVLWLEGTVEEMRQSVDSQVAILFFEHYKRRNNAGT